MANGYIKASPVPTPIIPLYQEYPLNLEIPFFSVLCLGVILSLIMVKLPTEALPRENNEDSPQKENEKMRSPLNSEGVAEKKINSEHEITETTSELEFYNWGNIASEAVGIIIAGNSGSAKTSLAAWLLGKLTQNKPAQVIALDPHANRNGLWEELGVVVVNEFALIEKQLELLEQLLDSRRGQVENGDTVIVVADELGACIKNFGNPKRVDLTLERLGSEGRKYGLILVSINTSCNADDINISAQSRNNFINILCGAAARTFAEQRWKKNDERQIWVREQAYPCLVTGAVPHSIAVHPTHGHHEEFAITGKEPRNILPVKQLPVTIPTCFNCQALSISEDAQHLLDWFNRKSSEEKCGFELREIQQSRPFGRKKDHKLETLMPLIKELLDAELIEEVGQRKYGLTKKVSTSVSKSTTTKR